MKYRIFIILLLLTSWYIFSGVNESFYIISGALSTLITVLILSKANILTSEIPLKFRLKYFSFLFYLIKEIVKSSIEVSFLIWTKKPNIYHTIGWIKCSFPNDLKKTIYANSITLTPGTICIDMHLDRIQVHCLSKESFKTLEENSLFQLVDSL